GCARLLSTPAHDASESRFPGTPSADVGVRLRGIAAARLDGEAERPADHRESGRDHDEQHVDPGSDAGGRLDVPRYTGADPGGRWVRAIPDGSHARGVTVDRRNKPGVPLSRL